jgi:hypothetical protein
MERPPDDGPPEDDWLEENWLDAPTEETPRPPRRRAVQPALRRADRRVVALVAAAALVLIIILAVTLGGDGDGDDAAQTAPTLTPTESATETATVEEPSLQVPEGDALTAGDSGRRVRRLQRALASLGYEVTPDGEYGPATAEAVSAFQEDADLDVDGVAGAQTIAAINEALANQE